MILFASLTMVFAAGFISAIALMTDSSKPVVPEVKVTFPPTVTVRHKQIKVKRKPMGVHAIIPKAGKLNYPSGEQGCEV